MKTHYNKPKKPHGWTPRQAIENFLKTTTLHGLKYLTSEHLVDRIGWVACCSASTCCAGVLCAVLWARFLQVPALLALRDMSPGGTLAHYMPAVAVCPSARLVAALFLANLTTNTSMISRLSRTVDRVLAERPAAEDQVELLEQLLSKQNLSLTELMMKHSPPCEELMVTCRWQDVMVPCGQVFEKEITSWGVCCLMRPEKSYYRLLNELERQSAELELSRRLDLAMQCSNDSNEGCEFFTKFEGEEDINRIVLEPGVNYFAQVRFTSVPQNSADAVLESSCVSDKGYSRALCLDKCAETACGCTDPLRDMETHEKVTLQPCTVKQIKCLREYAENRTDYMSLIIPCNVVNSQCECLPSCNKVTSYTTLESAAMDLNFFSVDPIYENVSAKSTLMHLRVNVELSKIFTLNPTENWLTLLSSLGGVFNMFMGVGLFSALEILFLLFVTLPKAYRQTSKVDKVPPLRY